MYLGLLRPVLEYASPVWDSCLKADAVALERVQLAIARAILHMSRSHESNRDVLQTIGWPTLAWRRRRYKLLLLWKLLHGDGPPPLQDHIPATAAMRTSYSLRNRLNLAFPTCSTQRRLKTFLPSATGIWNSLPTSVSSCSSVGSFLRHLDSHFSSDKFSLGLP